MKRPPPIEFSEPVADAAAAGAIPAPDGDSPAAGDAAPRDVSTPRADLAGQLAAAELPLFAATPRTVAPGPGAFQLGDFTIWGTDGDTVTAADFAYDSGAKTLTVNTDKRFAIQNTDQTKDSDGYLAVNSSAAIVIPADRDAHITLAGVGILSTAPLDLATGASCSLVLADGTKNSFKTNYPTSASATGSHSAIHCGTGSSISVDDSVANRTSKGTPVIPEDGVMPRNPDLSPSDPAAANPYLLANSTEVRAGDPLTKLDSENPGTLLAQNAANGMAAAIGAPYGEAGGNITINGGIITAIGGREDRGGSGYIDYAAGIGAAGPAGGNGTGLDEWITINGGRVTAQGAYHGPGIGGGPAGKTGNIRINGGYVVSNGGVHGRGFGTGCDGDNSSEYQIILTGGTLLPTGGREYYPADIGAPGAKVTITGGSIGNSLGADSFIFDGTATNAKGEPIEMIQVDLTSDVGESAFALTEWELKVDGEPYEYGAPAEFDKGHLYLWLPKRVVKNSEVTVEFTYLDTDKLDANGNPTPVTPLPLFRPSDSSLPPGVTNDGKLRRYADFTLDANYLASLDKYYDGKGAGMFPLPLRTPDGRDLTQAEKITFKYQHLDSAGNPVGAETGNGSDVGAMKFTAVSTQYSDDTEGGFSESYWGHRATGQFTIWPIASQVSDIAAEWVDDGNPGAVAHPSDQVLRVSATIGAAPTVDGQAGSEKTKPTCQAPRGQVQIYVDGQPVGAPVNLVYAGDLDAEGNPIPEGDPRVTAKKVDNGQGGSTALFSLARTASASDFLVPTQGQQGRHEIALRFLPPSATQAAAGQPANYLASAAPDEDGTVPRAEVAIDPIDPNPAVTPEPDPDCADPDAPEPKVETGPGQPADPGADPGKPGDKVFRGIIVTTWGEASDADPHPGRVILKVKTPSSGPISVTDAKGGVFEAEFKKDADGFPVRDDDGCYTLVIDPTAIGAGQLTFAQKPNGAYTGSTWIYSVTVRPDATVAPAPALAKRAENLTHPHGPTQPGDRIRYTITASNAAAGSLWTQVVVSDPLPACLELAGASVGLMGADGVRRPLSAAAPGAAPAAGQYALSAPGADGRRTLTAPVGDIGGGREAVLSIECAVRGDIDFAAAPAEDLSLENVASATGKRPDPDDPDGPDAGPVDPDPSDPAAPPGPEEVLPADPDARMSKAVENASSPGAAVTRVGDVLRYTITLENAGAANSCLAAATISDPLPAGLEPVPGTLRLSVDGGEPAAVPDEAYDRASRTVAVACGDVWGGSRATLTFQATVGEAALGADAANVAFAHGRVPSQSAEELPEAPEPGKPADPPTGGPAASSPPAIPPVVVGDDPAEGDLSIDKTAENLSRGDGTTHVGDTVRYEIALSNEGAGTSWMDAVIRDDVPEGLEPVAGTLRLTLPDGREVAVDDRAYDPKTRILAVACGHLHGGQRVALAFDALVTEAAVGADIGNVAVGYGTPPSAWDPDGVHPEPGAPFDPPGGWGAWERGRDKVVSDPSYPPGVDKLGGVVAEDLPREKARTTIAHRLAQTGDALAAAAGLPLAAALAAGGLALAARRRRERAR